MIARRAIIKAALGVFGAGSAGVTPQDVVQAASGVSGDLPNGPEVAGFDPRGDRGPKWFRATEQLRSTLYREMEITRELHQGRSAAAYRGQEILVCGLQRPEIAGALRSPTRCNERPRQRNHRLGRAEKAGGGNMTTPAPIKVAEAAPDPDVIHICRQFLDMAESGALRSVVIAGTLRGGQFDVRYTCRDRLETLGLMQVSLHDLAAGGRDEGAAS